MRQQQSTASSMRERVNKPSRLLEHDENELVFSLLGRRCQVKINLQQYNNKSNFLAHTTR